LYNVDSIAHLTIEQVVKDYYKYKLDQTASFLKTGKDIDKNISMIRLVVKFSFVLLNSRLKMVRGLCIKFKAQCCQQTHLTLFSGELSEIVLP
jgi:hypothetical protein